MVDRLYILCVHRQGIWERLIRETRKSPGRLIFPLKKKQSELKTDEEIAAQAGGNLFTEAPEIRNWLMNVEKGKDLVVGGKSTPVPSSFIHLALNCS